MDVHIGREQVTSWKDFLVRYLLIVAGILTAWAVNQWNEHRQHLAIAAQTRAALRSELVNDLEEIRKTLAFNTGEWKQMLPFRNALLQALQRGTPAAQIERELLAGWSGAIRVQFPEIRRDAWDAAVAGQAVTHLEPEELRRFSAAYAALRLADAHSMGQEAGGSSDLRRRYTQWQLDRQFGRTDPLELARMMVLWESTGRYSASLWQSIEAELSTALGLAPAAAAPPEAVSAPASAAPR